MVRAYVLLLRGYANSFLNYIKCHKTKARSRNMQLTVHNNAHVYAAIDHLLWNDNYKHHYKLTRMYKRSVSVWMLQGKLCVPYCILIRSRRGSPARQHWHTFYFYFAALLFHAAYTYIYICEYNKDIYICRIIKEKIYDRNCRWQACSGSYVSGQVYCVASVAC